MMLVMDKKFVVAVMDRSELNIQTFLTFLIAAINVVLVNSETWPSLVLLVMTNE